MEEKRCPFRKSADGEFVSCYGDECMAFTEYHTVNALAGGTCLAKSQKYTICRMITPIMQNYGCV